MAGHGTEDGDRRDIVGAGAIERVGQPACVAGADGQGDERNKSLELAGSIRVGQPSALHGVYVQYVAQGLGLRR